LQPILVSKEVLEMWRRSQLSNISLHIDGIKGLNSDILT
jgi:hypothetical protein